MNLYYLIASLPALEMEHAPALAPDAFAALCREHLAPAEAEAAAALAEGRDSDHPYARAWRNTETLLRNAAARQRALRRGADAALHQRPASGCDLRLERAVEEAFQAPDPLQRERRLDTLRWRLAEELQGLDPLGVRVVLAYALKLRFAGRWAGRTPEAGRAAAAALTDVAIALNAHTHTARA